LASTEERDPRLLEEVFRLACRYAGQCPDIQTFVRETQRALHANVGAERVRHYLDFLDLSLLVRLVRPLEIRLKKTRGAAKICLADHALRASWLGETIPLDPAQLALEPHVADLAGRIAESVTGTYLWTIGGLALAHFPARSDEPEVDFVLTVGTHRIPIEVKYRRRIDFSDTEGLRAFVERVANNAPFGVLLTLGDETVVDDPRIVVLPLSSLLLMR
jgi:predicted AAA+ superfamily ATPase